MEENKTIKVNINGLIALCHILDEYETFNQNLINFLKESRNKSNSIWRIGRIANGEDWAPAPKEKKFYKQNKLVIDTINSHLHIQTYICENYEFSYNNNAVVYKNNELYQYILNNKDKLDRIILVLEKLKKLGFKQLQFNENFDFTNEIYVLPLFLHYNHYIPYLDNLEAIPVYRKDIVKYKSTSSNYKMTTLPVWSEVSFTYEMQIFLNDLTFDADRLPNAISKEEITDKIIALQKAKNEEYTIIRNSVDFSIGADDLLSSFSSVNNSLSKLDDVSKKEELTKLLASIKDDILKIKALSTEYDKEVVNNGKVTEETLNKEKKAYQRRRELSKMHID